VCKVLVVSIRESSSNQPQQKRIGVALGGGSARGYAHIGAISVLEKHGFEPNVIAGTSFGAVVGAMYALGQSCEEMRKSSSQIRSRQLIPQITDFGLHKAALFSGEKLEAYFDALLEGRHFSDLKKELVVVATDVDTGERVLLNKGSLGKALRASASMPGIFAPVEIDGRRLVDGGLGSPVPLETLETLNVDLAIGIGAGTTGDQSATIRRTQQFLKSDFGKKLHRKLHNTVDKRPLPSLGRTLAYTANTYLREHNNDGLQVHTNPPIKWLHFHKAEHAILAGERALEAFIPKIIQALQLRTPIPALAVAGD
jgi:NTE family protein